MKFYNLFILTLLLFFVSSTANAQFSSNKKNKKETITSFGTGFSGAEMRGYSIVGVNLSAAIRKPFAFIGKNSSISFDAFINITIGPESNATFDEDKTGDFGAGILSINYNAFALSSKANKSRLGGFIGIGLFFTPGKKIEIWRNQEMKTYWSGMFGPAVIFGPSFKIGKSYMDIRFYGGVTMGKEVSEIAYGGMSIMYALGMKKKKGFAMR